MTWYPVKFQLQVSSFMKGTDRTYHNDGATA